MRQDSPDTDGQDAKSKNKESASENHSSDMGSLGMLIGSLLNKESLSEEYSSDSVNNTPVSVKTKVAKITKGAVIVVAVIVVMVFVWAGAVLLWYVARGWIAFLGLLFSGIVTVTAIIGLFGQDFLKNVGESFENTSEKHKIYLFIGVLVATFLILLAFLGTVFWQFDPTFHTGWPALDSSLSSNDSYWHSEINTQNQASCTFLGGAYYVTAIPSFTHNCFASASVFDNFIYQIQMQFVQGECGGINFRADPVNATQYYFEICRNPNPNKNNYSLSRWDSQTHYKMILSQQVGNLPSILKSNKNSNMALPITLAVVARGNNFELWVDGQELDVGFDLTAGELKEGEIGVVASGLYKKGATATDYYPQSQLTIIAFSNAKVWTFYGD